MSRVKTWSDREYLKMLDYNGFHYCRSKGDHDIYKRNGETLPVKLPINKMVARRMIKEHNLIVDYKGR